MPNWATNYPAFKYWDDKGFYIPAKNELITIFNNYTTIKAAVEKNGGSFDYLNTGVGILSSVESSIENSYELHYLNNAIYWRNRYKSSVSFQATILGIRKF
jgi:hypothetical protein